MARRENDVEFTTIDEWCRITGMGRTATYQALARRDIRGKKRGRRNLIDVKHGLAWLRSLPNADIRLPNSKKAVNKSAASIKPPAPKRRADRHPPPTA
jgi:hypothetical protein